MWSAAGCRLRSIGWHNLARSKTGAKAEDVSRGIHKDPEFFLKEILGFQPWSKQLEILKSVRDNPRTAVRSGHGSGKTAIAARTVLWFLAAHPHSVVVTTAPTWNQVEKVLWREMATAFERGKEFFQVLGQADIFKTDLTIAPDWYAVGLSTEKPERFAGFHSANILLVIDEASGVAPEIFEAGDGFLTSRNAKVLLIGNPTQPSGPFYDAFHKEAAHWNLIHISTFDTPAFTGEKVSDVVAASLPQPDYPERMKLKYGEDSAPYDYRVLGEFPRASDDAVCKAWDVERAQRVEVQPGLPVVISCDVARKGGDETVIAVRRGNHVRIVDAYAGKDQNWTLGRLLQVERQVYEETPFDIVHVIDMAGLGSGTYDALCEASAFTVHGFNSSHRARNPREFPNRRSEVWFTFSDLLRQGVVDLDPDDQLFADLVAPVYSVDSQGRRVVEAKDEMRKRLQRSPDRADAVLMAFSFSPSDFHPAEPDSSRDGRALSVGVMNTNF